MTKIKTEAVFYQTQYHYGQLQPNSRNKWGISDFSLFITEKAAQSYIDDKIKKGQGSNPDFWSIVEQRNLTINEAIRDLDYIIFAPFGECGSVVSDTIAGYVWDAMLYWNARQVCYLNNELNAHNMSKDKLLIHKRYLLQDMNFSYQDLNRRHLHALLYIANGGDIKKAHDHGDGK